MKLMPHFKRAVVLLCGDKWDKQDAPSNSTAPKILFSLDSACPNPSHIARSYKVHPLLVQLAETNFHVLLTLFTSDVTDRLWKNLVILIMKKIMLMSGTKATIVDPAQFPDKDHIFWLQNSTRCIKICLNSRNNTVMKNSFNDHLIIINSFAQHLILCRISEPSENSIKISVKNLDCDSAVCHLEHTCLVGQCCAWHVWVLPL